MAKLNLASPWVLYYRGTSAMFEHDSEVHVLLDEDNYILKIYVDDPLKADAIAYLMPEERVFGNISLKIEVIPANKLNGRKRALSEYEFKAFQDVFEAAFYKNPAFVFAEEVYLQTNMLCYVVFNKTVVQYFSDDLGSCFGLSSTIYEQLARDIFKPLDGVYYCTNNVYYPSYESSPYSPYMRRTEQ